MACDLCAARGTRLIDLLSDYATDDVKQICPACEKVVNDHLWKVRAVTANMNKSLLRRFIETLRGISIKPSTGGSADK